MDQWEFAGSLWGRRARRPRPQGDGGSPGRGAKKLYPQGDGAAHVAEAAALKPPLLGEVARRSRDGGVSGLCCAAIIGFLPRIEAQPIEATPQALRASSTRRGMATHTQLKLRFAAHLAEEPKRPHPQGDGDSHAAEAAAPKPPLLGEVARRSRDGGVSGLCNVALPGFFQG